MSSNYSDKKNSGELHGEEEETKLPGFRFHPTDEELVGFYLRSKVEKKALSAIDQLIKQIDIYKYDPWDLPKVSNAGEREWYFFCMRGRKYRNSVRPNRVTGSGFWKATGIDKPIYSTKTPHQCVGLKKSLVYYRGSAGKGTKTDWMMHEFRLPPAGKSNGKPDDTHEAEVWTVCRILKRIPSYKKYTPTSKLETKPKTNNIHTNSNSKTCSLESDLSFGDSSVIQQTETKPILNHVDHSGRSYNFIQNHIHYDNVVTQTQFMESYPGVWDQDGDDLFGGEDWDELRSVVQRAVHPSQACEYEWTYR